MRKIFFAAVLLSAISTVSFAQEAKKGDFNFGVSAGGGISTYRFDPDELVEGEKISPIANIQAGLVFDYSFVDNFFLEWSVSYQRKGALDKLADEEDTEEVKCSVHYIQVPLTLNYKINVGNVGIVPEVGPFFAVGLSGKLKCKGTVSFGVDYGDIYYDEPMPEGYYEGALYEKESNEKKFDIYKDKDEIDPLANRLDYGLRFALGLTPCEKIKIKVGYDMSMNNLFDKEKHGTSDYVKNKFGVFFGNLTYYFK
jgi:hypothetical protein